MLVLFSLHESHLNKVKHQMDVKCAILKGLLTQNPKKCPIPDTVTSPWYAVMTSPGLTLIRVENQRHLSN